MYTNTIIGSYNAIANSEHHAMIMKPPIKRQPKKSNSKEIPHSTALSSRGNSEESPTSHPNHPSSNINPHTVNPLSAIGAPNSFTSNHSTPSAAILLSPHDGPILPGLEILASIESVCIHPDKIFSPEIRKIGFSIDESVGVGEEPKPLLKCLPAENNSMSRSLLFQTLEGRNILQVQTETPYCCSWYKNLEAKVQFPSGQPFGTILKTAFGPCKCHRKFMMTCQKTPEEKIQFEVEVVLSPSEFLIKQNEEIVAKVNTSRVDYKTSYKVSFMKPSELSPNLKAMFIVFAIILHIAYAEKINTCLGMCLCCFAGSSVAAWILCLF